MRNIENGKAVLSLPNLLALLLALNDLTNEVMTLSDILGDALAFTTPSMQGMPVTREWMDSVLSGEHVTLTFRDLWSANDEPPNRDATKAAALDELWGQVAEEMPRGTSLDEAKQWGGYPTLAESRAATKLELSPYALRAWAGRLWGRGLDDEANARAAERRASADQVVTPQARGAVTRELIKEIREAIHLDKFGRTTNRPDNGSPA